MVDHPLYPERVRWANTIVRLAAIGIKMFGLGLLSGRVVFNDPFIYAFVFFALAIDFAELVALWLRSGDWVGQRYVKYLDVLTAVLFLSATFLNTKFT